MTEATSHTSSTLRFDGVPTFFRGCHLYDNVPYEATRDEWRAEIDDMVTPVRAGEDAAALRWFDIHFPECMKLVPRKGRVRRKFLQGVRDAIERGI